MFKVKNKDKVNWLHSGVFINVEHNQRNFQHINLILMLIANFEYAVTRHVYPCRHLLIQSQRWKYRKMCEICLKLTIKTLERRQ